jgi:hypothetical protein
MKDWSWGGVTVEDVNLNDEVLDLD